MSTKTIYLKLIGSQPNYQLQWSYDQTTWAKVEATSPSTDVNPGDEVDWDADDSIENVKIKFKNGNIIPNGNITGNDTKKPKGNVKSDAAKGSSDTYTIKVKPTAGGGYQEYDPDLKVPNED